MLMISVGEVLNILEEYAVCTPDEKKSLIQRINQASMFIDNIGTVSKWVRVEDKMPEKDVGVLVYTRNRFVSTLDHEDIDYLEENGEFHRYNGNQYISHWMPLPQKPESEDDAE